MTESLLDAFGFSSLNANCEGYVVYMFGLESEDESRRMTEEIMGHNKKRKSSLEK